MTLTSRHRASLHVDPQQKYFDPLLSTAALALMVLSRSWPEMEGRKGPFMGWPATKSETELKAEKLKSLKEEVAALEKDLNVRPKHPACVGIL